MRKTLLFLTLLLPWSLMAQKYASVNMEYIFQNLPDYVQAVDKLSKFAAEWQQDIEQRQQEVDGLREQFKQESYLLPDNLKQRRQEEIKTKDAELRALQRQRFGTGGDLDKKRAELLKAVQDRVYGAVERVAREKNYAFILDKAASGTVVYVNEKYDISDQVLEMLGVKPGAASDASPESKGTGKTPEKKKDRQ